MEISVIYTPLHDNKIILIFFFGGEAGGTYLKLEIVHEGE